MKITIHRGIDQIGGCITEISTSTTRILIDLGQNLPDGNGNVVDEMANSESVLGLTKNIDAIFYTHYHGDHLGLFHLVPKSVPQYIGQVAKQIALVKHQRLSHIPGREEISRTEISILNTMMTYSPARATQIGDIRITPYFVSHSAYDSYMFLIEAENYRIIHTGDFRGHGYLSKGTLPTIKNYILKNGKVDFLISEGTMLSRPNEKVLHEHELKQKVKETMGKYKYTFVMCSSTDLERLASVYAANKSFKIKPFVCDDFQRDILAVFSKSAGKESSLFQFDKTYVFSKNNTKLVEWMQDKGFCMLIRATEKFKDYLDTIIPHLTEDDIVFVFSMWKEYIDPNSKHAIQNYLNLSKRFKNVEYIHTSGHATSGFLAEVCNLVNPQFGIIPIHSENSERYLELPISKELKDKIITTSTRTPYYTVDIINRNRLLVP